MPKVITISDEAYEKLSAIKGEKSFTKAILSLIKEKSCEKMSKKEIIKWIEREERKIGKEKENISEKIDELIYGAKNENT